MAYVQYEAIKTTYLLLKLNENGLQPTTSNQLPTISYRHTVLTSPMNLNRVFYYTVQKMNVYGLGSPKISDT